MNRFIIVISIFILTHYLITSLHAKHFYDQENQYKGFYWFERQNLVKKDSSNEKYRFEELAPEVAAHNIELRQKQLEDARKVMLELAFSNSEPLELYKAIKYYRALEESLFDGALRMAKAWNMVNFMHPELADNVENPTNVFANRIKRQESEKSKAKLVQQFANYFDFILFEKPDCPYCQQFKTILEYFTNQFNMTIEVVEVNDKNLSSLEALGVKATPSLIAIGKNGKDVIEITRTVINGDEIIDNINLAVQMLIEQGKWNYVTQD